MINADTHADTMRALANCSTKTGHRYNRSNSNNHSIEQENFYSVHLQWYLQFSSLHMIMSNWMMFTQMFFCAGPSDMTKLAWSDAVMIAMLQNQAHHVPSSHAACLFAPLAPTRQLSSFLRCPQRACPCSTSLLASASHSPPLPHGWGRIQ